MRLRVAQRVRRGNHRRRVEPERSTVLQQAHPLLEAPAGEFDQCVQSRRTGALLGHPQVQYLLHCPARFAEPGQADHAARTLEGVESATDRGQEGLVGRRTARLRARHGYRRKHLLSLAEEDPEQFAVDLGLVAFGLDRLHRRGRRPRACDPGERALQRRFVGRGAGVEQRDRIARLRLERAVVDQLRVIAQLLERLAQFSAQRHVVGSLPQRPDQLAGALGVPGQHEFGRIRSRHSWRAHRRTVERHDHRGRLAPRLAQLGAESTACGVERKAGARAPRLLQAVDEEAECAQTGREQFAIIRRQAATRPQRTHALVRRRWRPPLPRRRDRVPAVRRRPAATDARSGAIRRAASGRERTNRAPARPTAGCLAPRR